MKKPHGLGKGLQEMGLTELLSNINKPVTQNMVGKLLQVDIDALIPGKYQPRQQFNEEALLELSQSIKSQGIIQPLIVRLASMNTYEIIAGERRWRAAKMAGLATLPIVIKEIDNEAAMAMGLIENMQREDLNVMDMAQGMDRLIHEFSLTHQSIADVLGKSRAAVTNTLRLLQLEAPLQDLVKTSRLEMGHARSLLSLPTASRLQAAEYIMQKALSVRATEAYVRDFQAGKVRATSTKTAPSAYEQSIAKQLVEQYGVGAKVQSGKITLSYQDQADLEALVGKLLA
jgi:ParB family chromosome partitioning protein